MKSTQICSSANFCYLDFNITSEEVANAIKTAEEFNAKLRDFIEKLTEESIKTYKEKALEIIKPKEKSTKNIAKRQMQ